MNNLNPSKIGILLISTPRFKNLGEGTEHGLFYTRKNLVASHLCKELNFAELIFPGIVYTREDLQHAMDEFSSGKPDMIFASFLSWSDDFAWIRFLRDMAPIPILFATIVEHKPSFTDSLTEDRFVDFLAAGGLVGSQEASGSISRLNRPMLKHVVGTLEQVVSETKMFAKAASLRNQLKKAVFGLLPSYNEVMWATYIDPYAFFTKAGPELRFLSVSELEDTIRQQPEEKVKHVMSQILSQYSHDDSVQIDKMYASVAASISLEELARKYHVEMLVLNDVDTILLSKIGLRPGFVPCPGTEDVMIVPEGDIGCGLACYILKKLSGKAVNFIEPFYINYDENTFTVGHAGPQDYTNPKGNTLISEDTRFAKSGYKYAGAPFAWHTISPGEKTMVHISQEGNSFKIVAAVVDALEGSSHFLAGYSHGVLKSRIPATDFFKKILNIGVTQHYALVDGNWLNELNEVANLLEFSYYEI